MSLFTHLRERIYIARTAGSLYPDIFPLQRSKPTYIVSSLVKALMYSQTLPKPHRPRVTPKLTRQPRKLTCLLSNE